MACTSGLAATSRSSSAWRLGAGKTYRMLQEGHAELESWSRRRDRAARDARSRGHRCDRRRARGHSPPARDVSRSGARGDGPPDDPAPRARSHASSTSSRTRTFPASSTTKRYEDVEDILAAGINVVSTLNVQHLESLNDRVAELTGRHTPRDDPGPSPRAPPTSVVLVDLSARGAAGPAARRKDLSGPTASTPPLNNFFRIENLAALREIALRQVAQEVEPKRTVVEVVGTRDEILAADAPQAVGERLLALVEPYPGSQRLVRRAWRSAQRLGSELDLLWVAPSRQGADRGAGAVARRAAPARLRPRRDVAHRGVRRRRSRRCSRRTRARNHVHPDGPRREARGLARLRTPLSATPDRMPAGRRRPHRCRPRVAPPRHTP